MLNVILGILMVSLVSASGFMLIENMSLQSAVDDLHENSRRLDVVADAITARLGTPAGASQGVLFAPAGVAQDGGMYTVPASVSAVKTSVSGQPFRYCPYAPDPSSASGSVVVSNDGYILKAPAAPAGIPADTAAVVISAGVRGAPAPACNDPSLAFVNGRLTISGGMVRMIARTKAMSDAQLTDGNSFEIWAAPGADGSGQDASHPGSLSKAMGIWTGRLPKSMIIHLVSASGGASAFEGVSFAPVPTAATSTNARNSKLSIIGETVDGSGNPVVASIATSGVFQTVGSIALVNVSVPGASFRLGGGNAVSLDGGSTIGSMDVGADSSVSVINSTTASVIVEQNASAYFSGSIANGVTARPGGRINFAGRNTIPGGGLLVQGEAAVATGAQLEVDGSISGGVVQVVSGGRMVVGGVLAMPSSGVGVAGDLVVSADAGISGNGTAVSLVNGSRFALDGTVVGSVIANGSPASISGAGLVRSGGGCWNTGADVFRYSTASSSAVQIPEQPVAPTPGDDAKANAVATNIFVSQSNAYSQALGAFGVNKSTWSCGS